MFLLTALVGASAACLEVDDHEPGHDHPPDAHQSGAHTHASALSILPTDNLVSAVTSGSWSSAATWSTGAVPTPGQNVVIPPGKTVTMNTAMPATSAPLRSVRVDGTLRFALAAKTRLIVDTIVVGTGGELRVGDSATAPIGPNARAEIIFAGGDLPIASDPELLGRGLLSLGAVKIFGAAKTAFLPLAAGTGMSAARDKLFLEAAPSGWRVGDRVLVTGANYVRQPRSQQTSASYQTQDETRTIVGITGSEITLDQPLTAGFHDRVHPGMPILAANLTRNVELSTTAANVDVLHRRGHVMFMSVPAEVHGAAFTNLGRTSKNDPVTAVVPPAAGATANMKGRYPIHIHEIGPTANAAVIEGSVVVGSPGWGVVLHSSNGTIQDNITYDVFASHFVTEAGDERGSFHRNLAVKSIGDFDRGLKKLFSTIDTDGTKIQDDGQKGHGFWFLARNISVRDNYAVSHPEECFVYFHRSVAPKFIPTRDLITPFRDAIRAKVDTYLGSEVPRPEVELRYSDAPIVDSQHNTAVACEAALEVVKANNEQDHDVRNMFVGWRGYNVVKGIVLQYTGRYTFRDTTLYAQANDVTDYTAGIVQSVSVLDTAYVRFHVSGWTKPVVLTQKFSGDWSTPAMLYVGGTVRLPGAAADVPFDVVSTTTSARRHVWIEGADGKYSVPWYAPTIHKTAAYSPAMELTSAYLPPAPTFASVPKLAVKGIPPAAWSGVQLELSGTRTDSAGAIAGDPSMNVPGYFSVWRGGSLRALVASGAVYQEGGKEYLDLPEHVVDRTTGHLRSFKVKVELAPYVP